MGVSVGAAGGGSSRRKSLEAEINLVPFIDLLSMCICFLLITAVWVQVGAVQVKQSNGTDAPASIAEQLDLDVVFLSPQVMSVQVNKGNKRMQAVKVEAATPALLAANFDQSLKSIIAGLGGNAAKTFASGKLTPVHGLEYGDLVTVMDVMRKNQISNLGVVPVRGN